MQYKLARKEVLYNSIYYVVQGCQGGQGRRLRNEINCLGLGIRLPYTLPPHPVISRHAMIKTLITIMAAEIIIIISISGMVIITFINIDSVIKTLITIYLGFCPILP